GASLFIILLSGIGLDKIIRSRLIPKAMIITVLITGILFIALSFYLQNPAAMKATNGLWNHLLQMLQAARESYFPAEYYGDPAFVRQAGSFTAQQILISGCTCLLIALLFYLRRFSYSISYIIALLAIFEVFAFARHSLVNFDLFLAQPSALKEFSIEHHGDHRIMYLDNPNIAMSLRLQNIWGFDPSIIGRYAEFMAFTQGHNPNEASQYLSFSRFHPLYNMLRCRYIFSNDASGINIIDTGISMPRLLLIRDWSLITSRDDIFAAMQKADFNPHSTVILETQPYPLPVKTTKQDMVTVINSSTDHLTIEANLSDPAILLITDAYSTGWRAKALRGSVQKKYEVMPANYVLCAVPLSKGSHHFRLEYMPSGFLLGKWISLISLVIYAGLLAIRFFIRPRNYNRKS
ncbi:MAG: YfhO family protein, partial [Candidatus Omnitrophota bacterium]